jgi:hypothetical protein
MPKRVSIIREAFSEGNDIFLDRFDDGEDEDYAKEIRNQRPIYRDIISMWFELRLKANNEDEFNITDIGNHLLKHHRPFINEFASSRMNPSNRLQTKRTYIEKRIKELITVGIIYSDRLTKAQKNDTKTPIYKFTLEGKVLSWLIACEKKEDEGNVRAKYIDLFASELLPLLSKLDSGILTKFMVDFFTRALEEHKRELVLDFFENTFDSLNEDDLYDARFYFLRLATRTEGTKLLLDTLYSYDKKKQELVLFQIKMDLECVIGTFMNGEFKQDWEVKRYHNVENPYIATSLMLCEECGTQYVDQIEILSFLGIRGSDKITQKNQHTNMEDFKCRKCGSRLAHNLDFFSLLDRYYLLDEQFRYLVEL